MKAIILNTDFEEVGIIDVYKSFIWADRYQESGDFEVYIPVNTKLLNDIKKEYYLWTVDSEHSMIIESIAIESDHEDGDCIVLRGSSLESLLHRRIVWNKTIIREGEKLQNGIKTLIVNNFINPIDPQRKIPNFVFKDSTDEKITSIIIDEEIEYFGEDIYDIVNTHCEEHDIGFKIVLSDDNKLVFSLYAGTDRSYDQDDNRYVIFSPNNGNLNNSNYIDSVESWKNVTLVAGDEEGNGDGVSRLTRTISLYDASASPVTAGISRREAFTNASGIKSTTENATAHLKQKGIDTLMENCRVTAFEGEQDLNHGMYTYGKDYSMGDIVQVENEYGQEGRAYVSEFIISCDESGITMYPTFKSILKGEYEA